jgi:hypothetical protein
MMEDELYSLDYMIKVFTNHCDKEEKRRKDDPDTYDRACKTLNVEFPEFNICKAFLSFSCHLKELREDIGEIDQIMEIHLEDYHNYEPYGNKEGTKYV